MAKIDITKTELVWPGKYNEDGTLREVPRLNLPFQVIETVSESRASRDSEKNDGLMFNFYKGREGDTFEDGWENKLIWGDNLLVAGSLLERFAGKVDLIYIDPPFATGTDFSFTAEIGDGDLTVGKAQSAIEEKAYRDTWGQGIDSFLAVLHDRVRLMEQLLSLTGAIYIHLDWRTIHYVKAMLDGVFSRSNFMANIIWKRISSGRKATSYKWLAVDDIMLVYTKGNHKIEPQYAPYSEEYKKRFVHSDERGPYFWDNIGSYSTERLHQLETEGRIRYPKNPNAKPRMKNWRFRVCGGILN
jgi:adenine-specific DNA-methyltransferase